MSGLGSRNADNSGLSILLGDSHTAANSFGFNGGKFANVPKSKFLFYVKFFRPSTAGGADWAKGLGLSVKTIDRPRVQFKTETLNQYNRKRVVQTSHEFESLQLKFHDTVGDTLQNMFVEYYQYYYGDSKINGASTSVYDVVTGEAFNLGKWGFLPPLAKQDYGYFFSHISVYQLYGGQVSQFDLINPKISQYNPDDFDYAAGGISNEIQMTVDFEGIVYKGPSAVTPDLITDMGLDKSQYWDVEDPAAVGATYGIGNGDPSGSVGDSIDTVLRRNISSLLTGQGTQSLKGIAIEVASSFDVNRGLAIGNTGLKSIKDLVGGNTQRGKQGAQGLLKGVLFGSPGKFF